MKYLSYLIAFLFIWLKATVSFANDAGRIELSMRLIGHELMLSLDDSTSRVLPVQLIDGRYCISFDREFGFSPDDLVEIVDRTMLTNKVSDAYRVEVENCDSSDVVYSYQVGGNIDLDMMPCSVRFVPEGCYVVYITLLSINSSNQANGSDATNDSQSDQSFSVYLFIFVGLLVLLLAINRILKKRHSNDPNVTAIGNYLFYQRTMELELADEKIELTSKEADLLFLLHSSVNETLERETILKAVWGDEGDYIGRTLDVFISKLRKKLAEDSRIRIINIRGVGYKLVVDE